MTDSAFQLTPAELRAELHRRLAEPAPGRIQLLAGPRQVGKTTLLLGLAEDLGERAIYFAGDAPEAGLPGAWERIWQRAEELAKPKSPAVVLLDEAHLLPDWSARLKGVWDRLRRRHIPVHVVATGSSSLRLGTGSRESLAGRFERMTLTHWSARALSDVFGLASEKAAAHYVSQGSYPGAFEYRKSIPRFTAYVRDAIVEPAIGRDMTAIEPVRRPELLRQVFAFAAASPAQIVTLQKMRGALHDAGALETIARYLTLLQDAFLVAPVRKWAARPTRQREAPPKLVMLNNALMAATDPRGIPDPEQEPDRYGAWIENACLAHAINSGQQVWYWREEPIEVDAVLDGSWGKWAVEVKAGSFGRGDLHGMLEFTRRNPEFRPLVLCSARGVTVAHAAGVTAATWQEYLLGGTAAAMPPR